MNGDPLLEDVDVATVEFYLRSRLGDPCKSWFNAKEVATRLEVHPSTAGRALAAIGEEPAADLLVDRRPGGRGGARYGITRERQDAPARRFWIERGERVREARP